MTSLEDTPASVPPNISKQHHKNRTKLMNSLTRRIVDRIFIAFDRPADPVAIYFQVYNVLLNKYFFYHYMNRFKSNI